MDFIGFFYCVEYYKIYEDEDGYLIRGKVEFIIVKNWYKVFFIVMLNWNGDNVIFLDLGD